MQTYDVSPMLSMINAVLSACQIDPETLTSIGGEPTTNVQHFLSLLCSLQSTLLVWCAEQTVADSKDLSSIAQTVVVQCEFKLFLVIFVVYIVTEQNCKLHRKYLCS